MNDRSWYIISTQGIGSRAIFKIQAILDSLKYPGKLWAPAIKLLPTTVAKKPKTTNNIIFPGYVFIETVIDDSKLEQALMEAKVGKFLKYPGDNMPAKVLDEIIKHIEDLEETNTEPAPQELVDIELGNLVEICVGPLIGFKGIVVKISGHSASIDTLVFGRSTPVSINIAHLTKLSDGNSSEEKTN